MVFIHWFAFVALVFLPQKKIEFSTENPVNKSNLLELVNKQRAEGCRCGSKKFEAVQPLKWNETLEKAAYKHSKDMADKNYFSHQAKDGTMTDKRIEREGYDWQAYGENIYRTTGYDATEEEVIKAWIKSPHHCENVMSPRFTEMAVAKYKTSWTQVFGNPMPKR